MLLLYSVARLAGFCAPSSDASKDLETGDLFEGNTSGPKDRSPQPLSQVSKATRFLFVILVAFSGLNLCAPNDRLGTILAKLAFLLSLTLAAVTFVATWRVSNTSPAASLINTLGASASYLANHGNSFVVAAISSVTILIVASHVQKPQSFHIFGLPSHRQPPVGVALSKHPFGLEREMAKSASMALKVHEQRRAALVGAAKTESEADQSDEADGTGGIESSDKASSPDDGAVRRRESYLDTEGDAPTDDSLSIHATAQQSNDEREMSELYPRLADDVRDNKPLSEETNHQSPRARSDSDPPSKAEQQDSPNSKGMKNTGTPMDSQGGMNKWERELSVTGSLDATLPASKPGDHSRQDGYGKKEGLEKDDAKDERAQTTLASEEATPAAIFPVREVRKESKSKRTLPSDGTSSSTQNRSADNLDLITKKTLMDLLVETQDSSGVPRELQKERRDPISQTSTAMASEKQEQTVIIGPVPAEAENL